MGHGTLQCLEVGRWEETSKGDWEKAARELGEKPGECGGW